MGPVEIAEELVRSMRFAGYGDDAGAWKTLLENEDAVRYHVGLHHFDLNFEEGRKLAYLTLQDTPEAREEWGDDSWARREGLSFLPLPMSLFHGTGGGPSPVEEMAGRDPEAPRKLCNRLLLTYGALSRAEHGDVIWTALLENEGWVRGCVGMYDYDLIVDRAAERASLTRTS